MRQFYIRNSKLQPLSGVSFFRYLCISLFLLFFYLNTLCHLPVPHIPHAPPTHLRFHMFLFFQKKERGVDPKMGAWELFFPEEVNHI